MIKNDYRRSLILLRPNAQGYSGHVRLERRTLMGTLYAVINAPAGGTLCAVLVRKDARNTYFAVRLGELRRDSRGQATLAYSFDPRNIDGRTLEDYQLIAIVHTNRENCNIVLSGNVNGSQEMDWNSVRAAACDVCACVGGPAGDICPQRPIPVPPAGTPARPGEGPSGLPTPSVPDVNRPAAPGTGPEELPTPSLPDVNQPAVPEAGPEELPTPEVDAPTPVVPGPEDPENTVGEPEEFPTPELPGGDVPAAAAAIPAINARDVLGINLNIPWPGVSEQVRRLFLTQPVSELMFDDDHVYVRAPMPEGSGYDYVEVGVEIDDGRPESIAYALPSRYTPEPPPGLEGYQWRGGASEGWWVIYTDPETGARLRDDD